MIKRRQRSSLSLEPQGDLAHAASTQSARLDDVTFPPDAFDRLVDTFQGPLLRYANRLLGDGELAQDAVQETFVRYIRRPPDATERKPVAAWLYRVTHNVCMDVLRAEVRRERAYAGIDARETTPAASGPVMAHEASWHVEEQLSRLSENQRSVIVLFFQEGKTYREIAAITGLSMSNVGMSLQRGLRKLRSFLEEKEIR